MRRPGPLRACVFCSANSGLNEKYFSAASVFSRGLAARGWELLYGGTRVGLMGKFADEMLQAGGVTRGAITEGLAKTHEMPHEGLHELVVVQDLFARKKWFLEEADVFFVFPGGMGTLDEALEVLTWKMLGSCPKPIYFMNIDQFWQSQLATFADMSNKGVIRPGGLELYQVCDEIDSIWGELDEWEKANRGAC